MRVVQAAALESAFLVVLDQVVVGIRGVSQRTQTEGVDDGQPEEAEVGMRGAKVGKVERDDVVTEQGVHAGSEFIKSGERLGQRLRCPWECYRRIGVSAHSAQRVDASIPRTYLEVHGEAADEEGGVVHER